MDAGALTRREWAVFWTLAALTAATRWTALSKTLWDWDEAQFALALRDFDVVAHHPHPPGFPLFIAPAKVLVALGFSDFHALQAIALIGAAALFPLMFWFARELRMPFEVSLGSALILAFLPNVWFYGGTAFSDVPSLAIVLLAMTMLLRGCRSGGAYVAGAFLLGVAAGFRPQNLLVGMCPALWATWWRIRSTRSIAQPLAAVLVGALTLFAAYGGAALATGDWAEYSHAVNAHRAYITAVDSFRSPVRPPLWKLFDDFFLRPFRMGWINVPISVLAALSLIAGAIGKRKRIAFALLSFGPMWLAGWLMLDFWSVSRFSIAWMPLVALAVADGSSIAARVARDERIRPIIETAIVACLVLVMAGWTLPGLSIVRRIDSPTVQAAQWCRGFLPPDASLYVHGSMAPFSDLLLTGIPRETFSGGSPPLWPDDRGAWLLREGKVDAVCARRFFYPREPLSRIARPRYFDVFVVPVRSRLRFGDGWYGEERAGGRSFRWMSGRGVLVLAPGRGETGQLSLQGYLPLDAMSGTPTVTMTLDGNVIDRFRATEAVVERVYTIASGRDRPRELELRLDRVGNAKKRGVGSDARDLGMRLDAVTWSAVDFDCGRARRSG